jgi:hypothetical protein
VRGGNAVIITACALALLALCRRRK